MTGRACGHDIPFGSTHSDPLSCLAGLPRESEMPRQLLCMSLVDEVVDAEEPGPALVADWRLSLGAHAWERVRAMPDTLLVLPAAPAGTALSLGNPARSAITRHLPGPKA
jgi:hypothetical protein